MLVEVFVGAARVLLPARVTAKTLLVLRSGTTEVASARVTIGAKAPVINLPLPETVTVLPKYAAPPTLRVEARLTAPATVRVPVIFAFQLTLALPFTSRLPVAVMLVKVVCATGRTVVPFVTYIAVESSAIVTPVLPATFRTIASVLSL